MAVLVAVLYAFSRMASENEVTALKAGGVSTRSLMWPALAAATTLALFMLWFNDQVLPTANHELATLQIAIFRTKPTFALKEQVINAVKEGQLYLRAGVIDRDQSGRIRDVTIYDVADPAHRRTIYGDSGTLAFATNKRDLVMHLFHGWMMTAPSNQPAQLTRVYFRYDELKVRDVANSFENVDADTAMKGEREMSICEMQKEYAIRDAALQHAMNDSIEAAWRIRHNAGKTAKELEPKPRPIRRSGGIGAVYCTFVDEVPARSRGGGGRSAASGFDDARGNEARFDAARRRPGLDQARLDPARRNSGFDQAGFDETQPCGGTGTAAGHVEEETGYDGESCGTAARRATNRTAGDAGAAGNAGVTSHARAGRQRPAASGANVRGSRGCGRQSRRVVRDDRREHAAPGRAPLAQSV